MNSKIKHKPPKRTPSTKQHRAVAKKSRQKTGPQKNNNPKLSEELARIWEEDLCE